VRVTCFTCPRERNARGPDRPVSKSRRGGHR
jgi:hypothetical protein